MAQAQYIIYQTLATSMHAMDTTVMTLLESVIEIPDFRQNVFFNAPLIDDYQKLQHV